jgi:4-aminobutyrate aminotransferase / (S)-3-amino-2-methylpropionate transaminase / 5-aminovalerate transaminase
MDAPTPGQIGGTFGGNPVAAAAGVAVMRQIEAGGVLERAQALEPILYSRLEAIKANNPVIGEVRGRGAMVAIEFVEPGTKNPNSAAVDAVVKYCHQNGVLVLNAGTFGNVIRFLPPLAITDAQLHEAMDVVAAAVASL